MTSTLTAAGRRIQKHLKATIAAAASADAELSKLLDGPVTPGNGADAAEPAVRRGRPRKQPEPAVAGTAAAPRRGRPPGTGKRQRAVLTLLAEGVPLDAEQIARALGLPNDGKHRSTLNGLQAAGLVVVDADGNYRTA